MGRITKAIFIVFIAIAIDRLCTLPIFPPEKYVDPFPFFDPTYTFESKCPGETYTIHGVSLQYIVKATTERVAGILYLCAFLIALPMVTNRLFKVMIVIQSLALADFFLLYEQSLFDIGEYHVEFTDFRIFGHAIAIILWKMGRL